MVNKLHSDEGYINFDILNYEDREKIAAFDYDHTLVKPNKGTFSLNVDDWIWLRSTVVEKILHLYDSGYGIVIFTNQSKEFKIEQIKNVLNTLKIPLKVFFSNSLMEAKKPLS